MAKKTRVTDPRKLGDVSLGDIAVLGNGNRVMVSWHAEGVYTYVRPDGGEPVPMLSTTPIEAVEHRSRRSMDTNEVADPLTRKASSGELFEIRKDGE